MAGYLFKFILVFIEFEFTNIEISRFTIKAILKVSFHVGIASFLRITDFNPAHYASISNNNYTAKISIFQKQKAKQYPVFS
jgi:hypothetical protein